MSRRTFELDRGDLWGALAACAVLLPQSMAFGVSLYVLVGLNASSGAYAGLAGTAALCIGAGLLGGTRGLISAPTGPVLVLLGSACSALAARGLVGEQIIQLLALIIAMAGITQLLLGLAGGGRFIKYMPYPVVSGFMTGTAILMILSQLTPLSGPEAGAEWSSWRWLPGLSATVTIIAAWLAPRISPRLPAPVIGLLAGTAAFHLVALVHGGPVPKVWMIGELPKLNLDAPGWQLTELSQIPWLIVLLAAGALALLASLDTLLTSVVADVATGKRHDARRELTGQGIGQMLSAVGGGMAGAGTTAATVVAVKSGGGRWVALLAGLFFIFLIAFVGEVGRWLPIGALAGVIISVAVAVADRNVVSWFFERQTRANGFIALLVIVITVLYELMVAVGVGVLIAVFLFIRDQIHVEVVHRRSTAAQVRSTHRRAQSERERLEENAERIVCFELRGNLFFGTADRLIDELGPDLDASKWVILNLLRVQRIDLTAVKFLIQIASRLEQAGGSLILCNLHTGAGLGSEPAHVFREVGGAAVNICLFNGRDEALEFAENALLDEIGHTRTQLSSVVSIRDNAIARYISAERIDVFESILERKSLDKDETLFVRHESGDALYLVLSGQIEVSVATSEHHHKRLAIYSAGSFFGELALLKEGRRAANAVATTATEVAMLPRDRFLTLKREHADIAIAILTAVSETLVTNQRWSTRELQRLSEW